jgi:hypothetical protein
LFASKIAWHDSWSIHRATPRWAAQLGATAGIVSFAGWAIGMWIGVAAGSLLWVGASIVMSAWTFWFGLGLARQRVDVDGQAA